MTKVLVVVVALLICAAIPTEVRASPARNVKATVLSRGTYPAFHVKSKTDEFVDLATGLPVVLEPPLEFMARAYQPMDIVVREHRYGAASENLGGVNSHTGWHAHPGPVFITVKEGELTIFELDDVTCSNPIVVGPGEGYVDTGHGHIAINASETFPAVDVTVITAPVEGPFRIELPASLDAHCVDQLETIHSEPTSAPQQ